MGLDVGLLSLYGCKGFGDLIVGSGGFWLASKSCFFFFGDIFWLFPAMMLQQIDVYSDTKTDAGQPKQN